jgi:hypothetical protein
MIAGTVSSNLGRLDWRLATYIDQSPVEVERPRGADQNGNCEWVSTTRRVSYVGWSYMN